MTNATAGVAVRTSVRSGRAAALADRLEQGARSLADFASGLTEAQWRTRLSKDGRRIGVIVHHVASMYPLEIELAQLLAAGKPITGVTWDVVHSMNAGHAQDNDTAAKDEALALLAQNSADAAAAIRDLTDDQFARAATISLYGDAPLTCQFMLEDHAVRHSFHHLARIQAALPA
jgi:hypothetical protein